MLTYFSASSQADTVFQQYLYHLAEAPPRAHTLAKGSRDNVQETKGEKSLKPAQKADPPPGLSFSILFLLYGAWNMGRAAVSDTVKVRQAVMKGKWHVICAQKNQCATEQKPGSSYWNYLLVILYYSHLCHILVLHLKTRVNINRYCAKIRPNFTRQTSKTCCKSLILLLQINTKTVKCICRENTVLETPQKHFFIFLLCFVVVGWFSLVGWFFV